jgi:hypothetical protein
VREAESLKPPRNGAHRHSLRNAVPHGFQIPRQVQSNGPVADLNRSGGNLTGVTVLISAAMWSKRLELLRDLIPKEASADILSIRRMLRTRT